MSRRLAAVLLTLSLGSPLLAATRITYDIQGTPTPILWAPTAFPLDYEIDQRLVDRFPAARGVVNRAFAAWQALPGTRISFTTSGVVANAAAAPGNHVAVSLADDLFAGQGAVAFTGYTYDTSTGRMLSADITVDPSLFQGGINADMALEHEVGHVLGLDHSAVLSSIMFPYVGTDGSPADFDSDDRIGIASMYPANDPTLTGATLQGRITGDDGAVFAAQVVAVNDSGAPVATVLSDASGEFVISGVPPGRYRIYAEPLDGPVEASCLQGTWGRARLVSFPTEYLPGSPIVVEKGKVYGNLVLNVGGSTQLNPRWIGAAPTRDSPLSLVTAPVFVTPGQSFVLTVAGDGFTSGMTRFEVLNPAFHRISDFEWDSNYVSASYTVDPAATAASAIVEVTSGRETAMLTGALKIQRLPRTRAVRR